MPHDSETTGLEQQQALIAATQGQPVGMAQFTERQLARQQAGATGQIPPPLEAQAVAGATRAAQAEEDLILSQEQLMRPTAQDTFLSPNVRLGGFMEKLFPQGPAADLITEDIFPTIDQPIQVGTVQGRIIGTQPIFAAPPALFPFNILEKRKKALEGAAAAKAKAKEEAKKKFIEGLKGSKTALQFQQEWKEDWIEGTRRWIRESGEDYEALNNNPEYQLWKENMVIQANMGLDADKLAREVQTTRDNPDIYYPPETIAAANKIASGDIDFNKEDLGVLVGEISLKGKTVSNLMQKGYANFVEQKIRTSFQKNANLLDNKGLVIAAVKKKFIEDIPQLAIDIYNAEKSDWDTLGQTPKDIEKHLANKFPEQAEVFFQLFRTESLAVGRKKEEEVIMPTAPETAIVETPIKKVKDKQGKVTTTIGERKEIYKGPSYVFSGTNRQPKQVNVTASKVWNPNTGEAIPKEQLPIGAFNADIESIFPVFLNKETGNFIVTEVGKAEAIPKAVMISPQKYKKAWLGQVVVNEDVATAKAGQSLWVLREDIEPNLKAAGYETRGEQLIFTTPPEKAEDITVITTGDL